MNRHFYGTMTSKTKKKIATYHTEKIEQNPFYNIDEEWPSM